MRAAGQGTVNAMIAKQVGKVLGPQTKFVSCNALRIALGVVKDAEDSGGQKFCNGTRHASEAGHEKVDGIPTEGVKRGAGAFRGVSPRIVVIQHVNKHYTQRPNVCSTWTVCRGYVIPALITHIRRAAAVHIRGINI